MATFATLKNRVNKRLGLDDTASGVDDVLLSGYLNDAVRDFLVRTKVNVNRGEILITSETDDAELSANVLAVQDLYIVGSSTRVYTPVKTSPSQIIDMRRAASGVSGSTALTHYAFQGNDMFMFYPTLATDTEVIIYYVPRPTEMSSGSDDPSHETFGGIPIEYHPALEMYASWQMADIDDDATSQQGLLYQRQYAMLVKETQRAVRHKGGRSLGPAIVGRRQPFRYSRSQDLY